MVNKTKKRNVLNAVRLKDTSRQEPETKTSSDLKEDPHDFNYEPNEELLKLIDDALNQSLPDDESKCEVVREAQERLGQIINEQTEHDLKQLSYDHLEQVHKFLQRILSSYDLYFYQCLQMCQQHARPQSKVCS